MIDVDIYHSDEYGGIDVVEVVVEENVKSTVSETIEQNYDNVYSLVNKQGIVNYDMFKYKAIAHKKWRRSHNYELYRSTREYANVEQNDGQYLYLCCNKSLHDCFI